MKAAIDIGTNTVLLLIAEFENGEIKAIHEEQRIPRLGKGVDENRRIDEEATQRIVQVLTEYKHLIEVRFRETESVTITATSAVRDAKNKNEFLNQIKSQTGFSVQLLSGKEEAEWTTAGALSVLPDKFQDSLILDIGGGSTEVAYINNGMLTDSHSFEMGSVRFTEKYLKQNPPSEQEIEECRSAIAAFYQSRNFQLQKPVKAVGVAGTLTTLASILQNTDSYKPALVNGYEISVRRLNEFIGIYRS